MNPDSPAFHRASALLTRLETALARTSQASAWMPGRARQQAIAADTVALLGELLHELHSQQANPDGSPTLRQSVTALDRTSHGFNATLVAHERRLAELESRLAHAEQLRHKTAEIGSRLSAIIAFLPVVDRKLAALEQQLAHDSASLSTHAQQLAGMSGWAAELKALRQDLATCAGQGDDLTTKLAAQQGVLAQLEAGGRTIADSFSGLRRELGLPNPAEREVFDRFYLAFENAFRGSEADIHRKQSVYASMIGRALERAGTTDWLDLGCGRGEWLQLVASVGGNPTGVDTNPNMIARCRELGLQVLEGDALDALRTRPAESLAGVSAFHLIEHLPVHAQLSLVHLAFAALRPGGCLVFETPNPQNVIVGACNFYMDPTHKNPVTPMTAEFIVRHAGFSSVEVLRLNAFPRYAERDSLPTVTDREMCEFFYGPQDFAIVAYK